MNFHRWIFAGTILQFIDINIGIMDISPDILGFIVIAIAFANLKETYAQLGFYTAILLSVTSFAEIMYVHLTNGFVPFTFNWTMAWVELISGSFQIILFACVFAVSKQIIKNETSRFPQVFLTIQLVLLLWPITLLHSTGNAVQFFSFVMVGVGVVLMIGYFIFLWRRKNMEQELIEKSRGPLVISPE